MKMKILSLSAAVISMAVIITACTKTASIVISADNTVELAAQSDDQSRFSTEMDAVANDANTTLSSSSNFSGRLEGIICDASVVADTVSNPRTITITYNGTNCWGNRTRTGTVVISVPAGVHWKDAGAAVTVSVQNLKVTRTSDAKSITINGSKTITNVSGGLITNLAGQGTITHTITSSGMTITFDDNTQRTWQLANKRVFTYSNGIVITTTGTHTDGSNTNIAEWGTNRSGSAFSTSITQPLVVRQDCNFRLVSGEVQHKIPNASATATFGLDAAGNPTTCPSGNYYFKLVWTINNISHSLIVAY